MEWHNFDVISETSYIHSFVISCFDYYWWRSVVLMLNSRIYVTVHRILATLVMTHARHVRTVRQKMPELSRNNCVRILLIKNFFCVRQHGTLAK